MEPWPPKRPDLSYRPCAERHIEGVSRAALRPSPSSPHLRPPSIPTDIVRPLLSTSSGRCRQSDAARAHSCPRSSPLPPILAEAKRPLMSSASPASARAACLASVAEATRSGMPSPLVLSCLVAVAKVQSHKSRDSRRAARVAMALYL
jgi:hypothetical protein